MKPSSVFQLRQHPLSASVAPTGLFRKMLDRAQTFLQSDRSRTNSYEHRYRLPRTRTICWALSASWVFIQPSLAMALKNSSFYAPVQNAPTGTPTGERATASADDPERLSPLESDIRVGRYTTAVPLIRAYLQQYPSSWRAHYDLGYVLFRIRGGKLSLAEAIQESIRELSQSLALNINNSDAHKILALDLVMIQRDDLAKTELDEAERLNPGSAEIHYLLGRHYMEQSNYAPAKKELEAAVQLDPAYMKAYENLGITLDRMGNGSAALTYYLKAIDLDEQQKLSSEYPYLELSKFYHDHNQIDLAECYALKALTRNPSSDQIYFELARNYREQSEWDKAADALTKAIAINPRAAQYYYLLGLTYHRLGEQRESRQAFANYAKYHNLNGARPESPNSHKPE